MKPTQQEIIELAREAGIVFDERAMPYYERLVHLALERFGAGGGEPMFWYRPCSNGMYEGPIHDAQIESVRRESGAWKPLFPHPSPTDLRAEYLRGLEDAASIVENADTPDCGGWTTCGIAEEIRALKGKQ